jgi:hypothetical protein
MAPTLLVLAAGLGARYGGLKQIDPVGPSGETLLDYAVFDALRAGFGRAVFVIRREFEDAFLARVAAKYSGRIAFDLVFQSADDVPAGCAAPAGRTRPLGTGHAAWCARAAISGPFAAINADDFYGADAFSRLAGFLGGAGGARFALVGFRLAGTLSEGGTVSRGICRERGGLLLSIAEEHGIGPDDVGPGRRFTGDETVSMNCWAFTPAVFPALESGLREFLSAGAADPAAEFYLPVAVSGLVSAGAASVEILPGPAAWFGVTHRGDRERAAAAIAALVRQGAYPARLFE